jgi:CCR4-NOT transcription complex subunit 1
VVACPAQVANASLAAPVGPTLAGVVNTESLESAAEKYRDFREPPESVADRVHFVMNNMTTDNLDSRAAELRDRVLPDFLAWFANYVVVKRAAQEANFHRLYISLLDVFADRELFRLMSKTTMYYVKVRPGQAAGAALSGALRGAQLLKRHSGAEAPLRPSASAAHLAPDLLTCAALLVAQVLLYSERILKESNDRALLKNLGTWLGLLTFARNKPVLSRDLELKQVIAEAYQRGRLIAVLPFVQKLLEGCRSSRVFTPSNPMVAGILSLLAELHAMKASGRRGAHAAGRAGGRLAQCMGGPACAELLTSGCWALAPASCLATGPQDEQRLLHRTHLQGVRPGPARREAQRRAAHDAPRAHPEPRLAAGEC